MLLTGGVRDARGPAAALCLGAAGVALSTQFILSEENRDRHPAYPEALPNADEGDEVAVEGGYGPCRGLRNKAAEALLGEHGSSGDPIEAMRAKIESMQHAQMPRDVETSLVLAGQVACAITELIRTAEFVPAMAAQAPAVLRPATLG